MDKDLNLDKVSIVEEQRHCKRGTPQPFVAVLESYHAGLQLGNLSEAVSGEQKTIHKLE
jgi:hypothetical protein